jgi:hypothetical protein
VRKTWLEDVVLASSGAIPALWAVTRAPLVPDVSHALGAARTTGFGWTGALRALDMAWAAPFEALPIGTRTFRAALASAFALALLGVVTHLLSRRLIGSLVPKSNPMLVATLATAASLMATLAPCAQSEGAAPAGSVLGAALALLPALFVLQRRTTWAFFALGLCASYELDVLACALPALILLRERPPKRSFAFAALGLVPLVLTWSLRLRFPGSIANDVTAFASPLGEGASTPMGLRALVESELGMAGFTLACGGAALALMRRHARHLGAALLFITVLGIGLTRIGAPSGEARIAPCVIASLAAACTLAAGAMHELAVQIARIDVPYARAASVMVVVLVSVLPLKTADDTAIRLRTGQTAEWSTEAVLPLAPHAAIVTGSRSIVEILVALRASGELAPDVTILPTTDVGGRIATHAVLRDPSLTPLARDLVLNGTPQEFALSEIANRRPLFLSYDPRWDRALARHLLPQGAFDRFLGEPRGPSDRKRALDAFVAVRDRLIHTTRGDTELRHATASLLRARALAVGAAGDRNAAVRTVEDLRRFAPSDATGGEIVKRIVSVDGPVDVADLTP